MCDQQHTSQVDMDDIIFTATANVLGNESEAVVPALMHDVPNIKATAEMLFGTKTDEDDAEVPYYDVSTEQATEEMPFDFDNNSNEDDAEVPYYDVSTEQATEEMPFDFGADPPKTRHFTNVFNDKDDTNLIISSPIQVEKMDGNYTFVGGGKVILKPSEWEN